MSIEALSMVLNHSRATGSNKVVLLGIANHLGPDAHEGAWPSIARLAAYANMTERGVQKCIGKLIDSGELSVQVSDGVSRNQYKPNRYWINVECPEDCDGSMWHRRGERAYEQGRTPVPSGVNAGTDRGEPEFTLISKETSENQQTNMFDQFWKVYPRKQNKGTAKRYWERAVRKADPRDIIEGAQRYRDDPNREDKYTAHASTWLNGERWTDDPLPGNKNRNSEIAAFAANFKPINHEIPSPQATGEIES